MTANAATADRRLALDRFLRNDIMDSPMASPCIIADEFFAVGDFFKSFLKVLSRVASIV